MPARKRIGYRLTLEDYARVYRCTVSTVVNWRAAGAPLDDPKALIHWLFSRRSNQPLPRQLRAYICFGKGLVGLLADFNELAAKVSG